MKIKSKVLNLGAKIKWIWVKKWFYYRNRKLFQSSPSLTFTVLQVLINEKILLEPILHEGILWLLKIIEFNFFPTVLLNVWDFIFSLTRRFMRLIFRRFIKAFIDVLLLSRFLILVPWLVPSLKTIYIMWLERHVDTVEVFNHLI